MTDLSDEDKSGSDEPNFTGQERRLLSRWREDLIGTVMMALLGPFVFAVMILTKTEYEMVLLRNSAGLIMLGISIVLQIMGMVVHISWTVSCGKKAPRLISAFMGEWLIFFYYLSLMFTAALGPAAIQVYEGMSSR